MHPQFKNSFDLSPSNHFTIYFDLWLALSVTHSLTKLILYFPVDTWVRCKWYAQCTQQREGIVANNFCSLKGSGGSVGRGGGCVGPLLLAPRIFECQHWGASLLTCMQARCWGQNRYIIYLYISYITFIYDICISVWDVSWLLHNSLTCMQDAVARKCKSVWDVYWIFL